jgi:ferric hydroxamate transport system substrate-binding protein
VVKLDRPYRRRAFLQLLAATGVAGLSSPLHAASAASSGAADLRLAAIDWAMLETACALGHKPVAACELIRFRVESPSVPLPQETLDLGLRGAPNFEQLRFAAPDLILSSPFYTRHEAALSAVAPVFSLPFFVRGEPSLPHALNALERRRKTSSTASRTVSNRRPAGPSCSLISAIPVTSAPSVSTVSTARR